MGGGGGGIECPEVLELILQLQINANNWQFSQLNIEPCTVPYHRTDDVFIIVCMYTSVLWHTSIFVTTVQYSFSIPHTLHDIVFFLPFCFNLLLPTEPGGSIHVWKCL